MPINHKSLTEYECDACGKKEMHDPMQPSDWVSVNHLGGQTDILCSWDCVSKHGDNKSKEKKSGKPATTNPAAISN